MTSEKLSLAPEARYRQMADALTPPWRHRGEYSPAGDLRLACELAAQTAGALQTLGEAFGQTYAYAHAVGNDQAAEGATAAIDLVADTLQRVAVWPALVGNILAGDPLTAEAAEDALAELNEAAAAVRGVRELVRR